jgi:hypothetical protein
MSSNALRKRGPSSLDALTSDGLLAALQAAHRQIETAFSELGAEAGEEGPDAGRFSAMRMRVGQALLAKRQIVGSVAAHLIGLLSVEEAIAVRELRTRGQHHSQLASEIIRYWTPDLIRQDWTGYCAASRDLRAGILGLIGAEKDLYYPLLRRQLDGKS